MKKIIISVILVLLLPIILVSCNDYDEDYVYDGQALIGKWQELDFDEGFYKVYDFKADGTVTYASCIYGMIPDGYVTAEYKVEGTNTLVLTEDLYGKTVVSRINFSINEKNVLVMFADGEVINKLEPYKLSYDEESPIKGKWLSVTPTQTDLFWFGDDSECYVFPDVKGEIGENVDDFIINGDFAYVKTILYSTEGNIVNLCFADEFIVSEESVITGEYKIENGKLVISSGGKTVIELERCE